MSSGLLWVISWCDFLGFPSDLPQWFYALLSILCIYWLVVVPFGLLVTFLDRKLSADLQARVGPNRAGPKGAFQPIADLIKLLQKENQASWFWGESLWLGVHTMALYSTLAVLPLGSLALLVDTEVSAFLPFWAALVLALGTMLLGLSQGSVSGLFGGIRIAAQSLAGSLPALVSILCAGVRTGSFKWSAFAAVQEFSPWTWTVFSNPFETMAFGVFVMSGMVLLAIPPLDGGLSVSDIHGGVSSHLHGRRLSLYLFGRFYGFLLWSLITVVMFLGAWRLPMGLSETLKEAYSYKVLAFLELTLLLAKTLVLMLLILWVARVNSRSRVDQITDFTWKVLSPFSLLALVGASFWVSGRAFW
ncbi:MAG: NADH-quinone oxidoreductase subunit H [Bdellovibrionia bacterium]